MKDAIIIFIVGLLTIAVTILIIQQVKVKKKKVVDVKIICPSGGVPNWNCKL